MTACRKSSGTCEIKSCSASEHTVDISSPRSIRPGNLSQIQNSSKITDLQVSQARDVIVFPSNLMKAPCSGAWVATTLECMTSLFRQTNETAFPLCGTLSLSLSSDTHTGIDYRQLLHRESFVRLVAHLVTVVRGREDRDKSAAVLNLVTCMKW